MTETADRVPKTADRVPETADREPETTDRAEKPIANDPVPNESNQDLTRIGGRSDAQDQCPDEQQEPEITEMTILSGYLVGVTW